jgi:hypothetical protein
MALSGATPRRDIRRLRWDAGKPLAAAAGLQPAGEAVEGDAYQHQQADGSPCVSALSNDGVADGLQTAEQLGQGPHRSADMGSGHPRAAAHDPAGGAHGARGQAAGLAALKQGLVGCGGAEQPPCGAGVNLTVALSAKDIRTFLVHLGDARDGDVEQDNPLAALHADA